MLCAVIGNPIAHSRSPEMYQAFAKQFAIDFQYERILAAEDGFLQAVETFRERSGYALNVTMPFKHQAYALSHVQSDIVQFTQSASLLTWLADDRVHADNFDGLGLVNDINDNWAFDMQDKCVLLIGAGGAVYGCLPILLEKSPKKIIVVNRAVEKLSALKKTFPHIDVATFDALDGQHFDLIINGTSSSFHKKTLPLPHSVFHESLYCYDMAYDPRQQTHFLQDCAQHGVKQLRDGLGMLIEQGAQAFYTWFQKKPQTKNLIDSRDWLL